MLTLHHLSQSRSFRTLWLLEELKAHYGTDYTLITHPRNRHHLAPETLLELHPMGKAPILIDDSLPLGENALAESAVIAEYLLKVYDKDNLFCASEDLTAWKDYQFWLHFAEGTLMPPLVMGLILHKAVEKSPFFARPIVRQVKAGAEKMLLTGNVNKSLNLLEKFLKNKQYLVNDKLTGADIQLYFAVAGAKKSGADFSALPNIQAWLKTCESRPAFLQAVALGGKPF